MVRGARLGTCSLGLRRPTQTHVKTTPQIDNRVPSCKPCNEFLDVVISGDRFATDGRSCRPLRGGSRRGAMRSDTFPFLTVSIIPKATAFRERLLGVSRRWGCIEIFMHESAKCQHRRDSTYTVPYVPTIAFCANARPRTLGTLPDDASRLMRGVPTQRLVGLRPPPCVVPPRKPIGFRQRTVTRKPAFAGHESSRNQS